MSDREYFNQRAYKWDTVCIHDENKIKTIINFLQITAKQNILDVGTGTGVLIPYLHQSIDHDGKITAIDISENMIAEAMKKYSAPNISYLHGDVLTTHFEKKFDIIICYSMFPHFKEQKFIAIEMMSRMLNEGGKLCIAHSQSRDAINAIHQKSGDAIKNDKLPEMNILKTAFEGCNLEITQCIDDDEMFVIIGTTPSGSNCSS